MNTFEQQFGKRYDADGCGASCHRPSCRPAPTSAVPSLGPAHEGSQKGISGSTLTGRRPRLPRQLLSRMSLMKMVSRMHGRSSQALESRQPHVKEELNHMQARGRPGKQQLQNDTAAVNGQKEFLADSQQVLGSTMNVKAVDAAAERLSTQRPRCKTRRCSGSD